MEKSIKKMTDSNPITKMEGFQEFECEWETVRDKGIFYIEATDSEEAEWLTRDELKTGRCDDEVVSVRVSEVIKKES